MTTTTNLNDFGICELEEAILLLRNMQHSLPGDFVGDEIQIMMNKDSGMVFLTNSEFQVAAMNVNKLEIWHYCYECGHEGFSDECQLTRRGCNECHPEEEEEEEEEENN